MAEVAVTTRLLAAVSPSLTTNPSAAVMVSSPIVWLAMVEMVGGSLTGFTVRTKLLLRTFLIAFRLGRTA